MRQEVSNEKFLISCFEVGQMPTNCYVVLNKKENKAAVLDPGCYNKDLLNYLEENKIEVLFVILTHGHFDHILGVNSLNPKTTYIHEYDEKILYDSQKNAGFFMGITEFTKIENVKTLKDNDKIEFFDDSFKTIHTKGHTMGSCCFILDKFLFTGDTIFKNGFGRCDLYSGDSKELRKSIDKIKQLDKNYIILPGHGPITTFSLRFSNEIK